METDTLPPTTTTESPAPEPEVAPSTPPAEPPVVAPVATTDVDPVSAVVAIIHEAVGKFSAPAHAQFLAKVQKALHQGRY